MPDEEKDSDDEDDEKQKEEPKKKKATAKAKPKGKGKGKGKGGVQIPEEWPWEEAKELFKKPEVQPSDEVEVRVHSKG
jgi:flap endonuclease-1